jgi:kinesin family member C1
LETELLSTKTKLEEELSAHQKLQHVHEQHVTKSEHAIETLTKDLTTQTTRATTLEQALQETTQKKDDLTTQLKVVQSSAGASSQDQLENMMRLTVENENLKKRLGVDQGIDLLSEAQERVHQLEQRVYASDAIRRALHNKVQELRGNVRVAVRVRPLLGNEPEQEDPALRATGGAIKVDDVAGEETDSMELSIVSGAGAGKRMSFDKVFGQSCNQNMVFREVSELVQSALDGFNVCIFAYGQTGSGKTFTMQGGNTEETRGIIPRSIAQILETSKTMAEDGWVFSIKASFLEIYNEEIVDLLSPHQPIKKSMQKKAGSMSFGDTSKKKSGANNSQKLIVRQMDTGMSIEGLEEIDLHDFSQLDTILGRAEKNRR